MWAGIPAGDRSPYRSGIGGAYDVIPDGDVYYGSQVIDFSYGQSSPDLDDFYISAVTIVGISVIPTGYLISSKRKALRGIFLFW